MGTNAHSAHPPPNMLRVALCERHEAAPGYHVLTFALPDDAPMEAQPGQFVMLRGATWGNAPLLPRPMSLLTSGTRPSVLIKVVGEGTLRMAAAYPGEPFELNGPLGVPFVLPPRDHRVVLVAGGVGIVPLVYFARSLSKGPAPTPPMVSLYGGRTAQDLPLAEALAEVGDLRVATEDGSRGTRGRVTALLSAVLAEDVPQTVYTCGPNPMMAAVAQACAERGVRCYASLEAPMACGYGVCLGCNVPDLKGGYLYVCSEGPCIDATRVDWSRMGRVST